jgi:uncharacterized membrane protein
MKCCRLNLFLAMAMAMPKSIDSFGATNHHRHFPSAKMSSSSSLPMAVATGTTTSEPTKEQAETAASMPQLLGIAATTAAAAACTQHLDVLSSDPIAQSLVAAAIGVVTVSSATALLEQVTSQNVPVYDSKVERYDQSTFAGRYCKMLLGCDPRLLLYSQDEVRQCQAMAYGNNENDNSNVDHRALWEAKRIADSALNLDTDEWVPRPFRMSGYLPYNGPICIAMVGATSTLPLLFWSWLNQSQNAMVNHSNRNAAASSEQQEQEQETLLKSYAIAVSAALVFAFGLSEYIQNNFVGDEMTQLLRFVSFPSAVVASSLNCFIVRSPELETGVPLLDDRFEPVLKTGETSLIAAQKGVYSTTASRGFLQMPTFFIPSLLLDTVTPLKHFLDANPACVLPVTTYVLLVVFGFGLPAAVGVFPQMSSVEAGKVEPHYRDLIDPQTGEPYTKFYFNKGL